VSVFAAPSEVNGIDLNAALGHLLAIQVLEHVVDINTSFGKTDAVRCNVHNVNAKETTEDTLLFPRVLVGSLKARVGETVLAVLRQGVAKPGQSAPWILEDATGNAKAVSAAKAYLAAIPKPKTTTATVAADSTWGDEDDADNEAIPF